jgi:two-component system sensor histidine kinase YesM
LNDEGVLLQGSSATQDEALIDLYREQFRSGAEFRKTDRYFLFAKRVDHGALTLMKAIPISTVTESANDTVRAGLLSGLLFAALSAAASIVFSLRITRPIVSLARTMRMTTIQQFELKSVQNRDEIGLLEHGYNSMMKRMKELIENEYIREIEVKEAQLMALQAQINPHFLNNTLNLIGGIALANKVPEIYRITKGIGELLRYSISMGDRLALLEDEVRNVRNYLFIQEQRFLGRCTVRIDTVEPLPQLLLPRFTLQPLVENAFEHGLQPKEGQWHVQIRIRRVGSRIAILIQDNGVGMKEGRLREIRGELRNGAIGRTPETGDASDRPRKQKGIGLANVDSRVKLHFGGSGLQLYSEPGAGTLIVMKLPMQRGGAEHV